MAIAGKKRGQYDLSAESILQRITEYDIYRYYTQYPFKLGIPFNSPLREDKDPSFVIKISKESGFIYHMDFVHPEYRGNSFQYVQQMYGLNYNEALQKIDQDFGLGILPTTIVKDYKSITCKYEQPPAIKVPPAITVIPREFNTVELNYWKQYHITLEELIKYRIYAIGELWVDGRKVVTPPNEIRFAYKYIVNGEIKWKIYSPFIDKSIGYKWFTNVPIDTMEGLTFLVPGAKTIITKSRKDLVVIRKFIPSTCAGQNESPVAISINNINIIKENSDENYIAFDCDDAGKRNSRFYTENYGFKHINVPDKYLAQGVKDFSDMARVCGLQCVQDYFGEKGLLC